MHLPLIFCHLIVFLPASISLLRVRSYSERGFAEALMVRKNSEETNELKETLTKLGFLFESGESDVMRIDGLESRKDSRSLAKSHRPLNMLRRLSLFLWGKPGFFL